MSTTLALPLLDLEAFRSDETSITSRAFVDELREVVHTIGFFYVTGHGVDPDLATRIHDVSRAFFELPEADRLEIENVNSPQFRGYTRFGHELTNGRVDLRDQIDISRDVPARLPAPDEPQWLRLRGPNLWPTALPELRDVVTEWLEQLEALGRTLLRAMSLALGQPADHFDAAVDPPEVLLKLIRYVTPAADEASGLGDVTARQGVGAHRDTGFLSFVHQDDVGGLQVERDGRLIDVPSVPGAFVVNIGEMLQLISGGYFKATVHQVVSPPPGTERFSVAYFFNPQLEATLAPVELPAELAAEAPGGASADPSNPILANYGDNSLKVRFAPIRMSPHDTMPISSHSAHGPRDILQTLMIETPRSTDTLEQLADQLDRLARSATDWRHSAELVDGLQHVLRSIDVLDRRAAPGAAAFHIRPSLPYQVAAHVGWYDNAPDGAPRLDSDVDWDPDFVQIEEPEHVTLLADWGPSAAGAGAVGPLAITAPFRILGDAGLRHFQAIASELDASAVDVDSRRVPRHSRGAIYRSSFLQGLHTDPTILDFLSSLAGIRIEPHPNGHHASHFNFAPTDISKAVDSWHTDVTAFDAVMHVFDIDGMAGGGFEYFDGPADEGRDLLATTGQLPTERVIRPEFPGAGWMVFQQGNRVLHRAAPLLEPWRRCTYVPSFIAHHPTIEDPDVLGTLVTIDGPIAAPVEYARHRCHVSARRLREVAELPSEAARRDALRRRRSDLGTVLDGLLDPAPAPFVDYG